MNEYTVTISKEHESYNKGFVSLLLNIEAEYNTIETKDGTVYEIQFSNVDKMEKFKAIVSEHLKFINN